MAKHEVRQVLPNGNTQLVATAYTYETAIQKRQENGLRLAAYHGLPITMALWVNVAAEGEPEKMVWMHSLTTSVQFTTITPEYED